MLMRIVNDVNKNNDLDSPGMKFKMQRATL